jgi:hypothetical protein
LHNSLELAVPLLTSITLTSTFGLLYPEHGGCMFLQNIIIYVFTANKPQGITSQKTVVIFTVTAMRTYKSQQFDGFSAGINL